MRFPEFMRPLLDFLFLKIISPIQWEWLTTKIKGKPFSLTPKEQNEVLAIWSAMHTITLTRRNSHITTYLIQIAHFIVTGKWNMYYAHALFNDGPMAIEAIGEGVVRNGPEEVLNVDGIAVLVPKGIHIVSWEMIMEEARRHAAAGTKYDNLFNVLNDNRVSCIEFVYDALKEVENHRELWPNFFDLVEKEGNVTPQMLYDCPDFEIIYEVRH